MSLPRNLAAKLEKAQAKRDIARADFDAARFKAAYDAVAGTTDARRARRQPTIEYGKEEAILPGYDRLKAIQRGRDLCRNFAAAKGMLLQFQLNVVGLGQKIRLHTENPGWNAQAGNWFNRIWARECDGRGGRHLADLERMELCAVLREGDILCWFDATGIMGGEGGKLWYWEADQLVEIDRWPEHKAAVAALLGVAECQQSQGVIMDGNGAVVGYAVHPGYGMTSQNREKVTILPAADALLLANPFRAGQVRGIPELLTIADDLQDLREFRRNVLIRAKVQATLAMVFTRLDAAGVAVARADTAESGSRADLDSADVAATAKNYENLERFANGAVEYLEPGEDAKAFSLSGDAPEFEQLSAATGIAAGFGLGLTRLHSQGKADASYSASRAEGNLDEALFDQWQQWLERYSLDWKASRALTWAIDTGKLIPQAGYKSYSWTGWPAQRSLNPQQEETARATKLANGATDYGEVLGPDWQEKFDALGAQLAYARAKGIPLAMLAAAASGAVAAPKQEPANA